MVLTDMTQDPDILEEMRGSKVRLLWGLDDLVAKLADLPDGDQVQKQLGKRYTSREVETLSRRPAAARPPPPPKTATLTVSGEPVTVRDGDGLHIDVHLHFTITAPGDGDGPSLNVQQYPVRLAGTHHAGQSLIALSPLALRPDVPHHR